MVVPVTGCQKCGGVFADGEGAGAHDTAACPGGGLIPHTASQHARVGVLAVAVLGPQRAEAVLRDVRGRGAERRYPVGTLTGSEQSRLRKAVQEDAKGAAVERTRDPAKVAEEGRRRDVQREASLRAQLEVEQTGSREHMQSGMLKIERMMEELRRAQSDLGGGAGQGGWHRGAAREEAARGGKGQEGGRGEHPAIPGGARAEQGGQAAHAARGD